MVFFPPHGWLIKAISYSNKKTPQRALVSTGDRLYQLLLLSYHHNSRLPNIRSCALFKVYCIGRPKRSTVLKRGGWGEEKRNDAYQQSPLRENMKQRLALGYNPFYFRKCFEFQKDSSAEKVHVQMDVHQKDFWNTHNLNLQEPASFIGRKKLGLPIHQCFRVMNFKLSCKKHQLSLGAYQQNLNEKIMWDKFPWNTACLTTTNLYLPCAVAGNRGYAVHPTLSSCVIIRDVQQAGPVVHMNTFIPPPSRPQTPVTLQTRWLKRKSLKISVLGDSAFNDPGREREILKSVQM